MIHNVPSIPKRRSFGSFWRIVTVFACAKGCTCGDLLQMLLRRNSMLSFKRTKRRNYQNPREKYIAFSLAGAFALLLILTLVGFTGQSRLRARLAETQDILAAAIQSDLNDALDSYAGIDRKSANLSGDILPTMRRHMYSAYEMDRILVETDCPYLPPVPHRGELNYSGYMKHTAEAVAEIRGVTFDEIARTTWENACRLFGIGI